MKSCCFFGHRDYNYTEFQEELTDIITQLIEKI